MWPNPQIPWCSGSANQSSIKKSFQKKKKKKEFIDDQIILVIYICFLVPFLSQTEGTLQKWFKIIGIVFFKISR